MLQAHQVRFTPFFPFSIISFHVVSVFYSFSNSICANDQHKSLCFVSFSQREGMEWNDCHPAVTSHHITSATVREERVKVNIIGQLLLLDKDRLFLNTNLPWQQLNVIISKVSQNEKCPHGNISGMHIAIMHLSLTHHKMPDWMSHYESLINNFQCLQCSRC